jgi:hypothetical protein
VLGFDALGVLALGEAEGGFAYSTDLVSGIGFPSYARDAVWSETSGWATADYPLSNLADLENLRRVAVHDAAGAANLTFVLPAAQPIDLIAFVHHNAGAADTFRIRLSAGADPLVDTIYDSGEQPFWPDGVDGALFPTMRPFRIPAVQNARSGYIDLSSNASPWEIAAIEIAKFWAWPDIGVDREIGIESHSLRREGAAGVDHFSRQWSPRLASGQRAVVDQSEVDVTLIDFQRFTMRRRAFIWAWNINKPSTWAREAFIVKNRSLPAGTVTHDQVGAMAYDFEEHLG